MRDKTNSRIAAITGIGMITPLGLTTSENWENFIAGRSGIREITKFNASACWSRIAGQLPERYDEMEKRLLPKVLFRRYGLPTRLSMLTVKEALEDAKINLSDIDKHTVSVITGCGGSTFGDQITLLGKGLRRVAFVHDMLDAHSGCISMEFGFKGPSFNVSTACSSGAYALDIGVDHIRLHGDVCLVIGVETLLYKETIDGFCQLMALSEQNDFPEKASCPFDKKRSGFVFSEGCCAMVLESYAHARRRDARIYGLISGTGATSEAYNILAPEPKGVEMARTMELALERSGLSKDRVGYINAHGTSTMHNDRAETEAIKKVFGQQAYDIPVSSQKSMIGHTIGAAGAIECAVTALSLYHGIITPTINYETFDPECDLDYVPNSARKAAGLGAAITNSFAFGGHNVTLVLESENSYFA
jgi:3-oxoacyl-[acyl-carrier-protein] synthase II